MPADATSRTLPTRDGYDRWASVYDGDGNPLVLLEERVVPTLLGDLRGLQIADVGCGTGRHALRLASAGAHVTALDFSDGMLAAARAKPGADKVDWIQHDIARPLPLPARTFDAVLCCLVLDHVEDVAGLCSELGRVCRGFILVTVMHPAMMLRGVQARFTDPDSGERVLPRSVPNQISDYVMGAAKAGLRIDHMSEHPADETLVRQTPRAEKHLDWPMLLVMKMRPA